MPRGARLTLFVEEGKKIRAHLSDKIFHSNACRDEGLGSDSFCDL